MSDNLEYLKSRRSCIISKPTKLSTGATCKSDLNVAVTRPHSPDTMKRYNLESAISPHDAPNIEYYKKYEHDEVPVKDQDSVILKKPLERSFLSLTNSELDQLEKRIFQNVSQELKTDESSLNSLESHIKFFKTTVEHIFENFYSTMSDFEHYKKRFHEILDKSKAGSIEDMEDFIKDMFDHIMSSENSSSQFNRRVTELVARDSKSGKTSACCCGDVDDSTGFVEAYKNDNYLTDSTIEDKNSKTKGSSTIDDIFNIILLGGGGNHDIMIKLNDRNLLSEINVKKRVEKSTTGSIASADDLKKVAAKKLEVERYIAQSNNAPDRDIPVRGSSAKRNINLNEEVPRTNEATDARSFFSKFCSILCKKFRKTVMS